MLDVSQILPVANSTLITVGVAFVAYNQFRNNQGQLSQSTVQILKDNVAAKDIELARMRSSHDTAIASLKAEVATITAQLENLKQANIVLQNTVTGKETLTAIVEIMKPIPGLFVPGGFIDTVTTNQQKTLKDLSDIRQALQDTPLKMKHEKFKQRAPRLSPSPS